ncbi:hypothetical protein SLA2020_408250 [Shorea laevis]
MSSLQSLYSLPLGLLLCFLLLCPADARRPRHYKPRPYRTFYVDQTGNGNFSTIQSAIDYVPENNKNWIFIRITAGTYREKVRIPYNKPYIILKGAAKRRTVVAWDDYQSLAQSPTFMSLADSIVVKSMTFVNSYNSPNSNRPMTPAVAAMITGDKCSFYRVGFIGLQDTLWDDQGRHYFHRCTIQGAVDFIFGSGQSVYENCAIVVRGDTLEPGLPGFITAQGRTNPTDGNGFVFKNCAVFGSGSAFLGRPWRGYSRVLFYNSSLSPVIQPGGWEAWNFVGHEWQLTFAEYGNYGPGSNSRMRVKWAKKLSLQDVNQLTSMSFIDREGWLRSQPV